MFPIIKLLKKDNICVISLMLLYENRKAMVLKVLGSVIYCIMYNYICVGFVCLQKAKLSLEHKGFENTTFNYISIIVIPELLIKIISCCGFANYKKATFVL